MQDHSPLLEAGTPVEIEVTEEPFFELDRSLCDDWRVEDGRLHCRVLFSRGQMLFLNGGFDALKAAGLETTDKLELEAGEERRRVLDRRYLTRHRWTIDETVLKPAPESDPEELEALRARYYTKAEEADDPAALGEELAREETRRKYHPDDLLHPPLYVEFDRNPDFADRGMIVLRSVLQFGGPLGLRGPFGPVEIHLDLEPGSEVMIRKR